ncbi:MAG: hypothetical protein ABIJ65_00060 [Chloroflexota bacterium]
MKNTSGKIYKVVAIVLMAMTAAMNILGGAGTSCAAFFTKNYPPYWILIKPVDYRWLYQTFVVTTLIVGIIGISAVIGLVRGGKRAYRNTLIVLAIGTILNAIHFYTSLTVIGKATPANVVFYINALTLIVFLVLGIPALREKVDFSKSSKESDKAAGAGLAAMVSGVIILSTPMWVGSSHIYMGTNWVYVFAWPIYIFGTFLTVGGIGLLAKAAWATQKQDSSEVKVQAL